MVPTTLEIRMLTLLGKAASINVRKVLWLCEELALPLAREDWGAGHRSTQDPAFLALNPNGLVPVLKDGALVLWESNVICRYLAAREGRTDLLPVLPAARARVEQWMDWQATELNNAWRYAFLALVRHSPDHANAVAIEGSVRAWNRHIGILAQQLELSGPYVAGPTFTLADIVLGLSVHRWVTAPIDKPLYPAVTAYYERLAERSGFRNYGRDGGP
jgi:glutathione S-transferase